MTHLSLHIPVETLIVKYLPTLRAAACLAHQKYKCSPISSRSWHLLFRLYSAMQIAENEEGQSYSSSDDGEGWLQRFDADDGARPAADVRDSIKLPAREVYFYGTTSDPSLQISVRCSPILGIGHQLWPATFLLTSVLEERHAREPGYWTGKRVLELGSGCGLVGLLAAALGAHVLLTDLPPVLDLLRGNAAANAAAVDRAGGAAEVAELIWGQPALPQGWERPDFVLAADLVYHRNLYHPLVTTLAQFGSDTSILVANVRRWKHAEALFFKPAKKLFQLTDMTPSIQLRDTPVLRDMTGRNRLRLHEFRRLQT